jgi:hypothetical protein
MTAKMRQHVWKSRCRWFDSAPGHQTLSAAEPNSAVTPWDLHFSRAVWFLPRAAIWRFQFLPKSLALAEELPAGRAEVPRGEGQRKCQRPATSSTDRRFEIEAAMQIAACVRFAPLTGGDVTRV